jgi:MFS family permease
VTGLFANRPRLPRPVWLVSWTSFFTDTASEMVYPLMPLYLTTVLGATALTLGIIEGAAEGLNSLLKIVSGVISDRWSRRKPFVIAGYGISSAIRPFLACAASWPHVLALRLADRVGKGLRTAPRDALLASWSDPATRGYVFGLHRSMDHLGAMVGPLLASLFLWAFPGEYRWLFALTIIPGTIAVLTLLPVPDTHGPVSSAAAPLSGMGSTAQLSGMRPPALGAPFYRYLGVVLLFGLGNSTDAYLLLRLSDVGVAAVWIPIVWSALHVVKAAVSPIGGIVSDRLGRRGVIVAGWLVYATVYGGFALASSLPALLTLFFVYGLYYGLTEGVEKAVVADLAPAAARGRAFGLYHAAIGIAALVASLLFGAIWKLVSAPAAFGVGAALALVASLLLMRLRLTVQRG